VRVAATVLICRALQPPSQLVTPIAGENEMCVRVDETRHEAAARRVQLDAARSEANPALAVNGRSYENDATATPGNGGVAQNARLRLTFPAKWRRPGARRHLGGVVKNEVRVHRSSEACPPDL
jgi:hypothetical protein